MGGERGELFQKRSKDTSWQRLPLNLPESYVIDIGQFQQGDVFVLVEQDDAFRLLRSRDGQRWRTAVTVAKKKPGWLAQAYNIYTVSFPYTVLKSNSLDIWIDKQLIRYDAISDEQTVTETIEFSRLYKQGNGILIGRPYSGWSGEKQPQYSRDGGDSWKKVDIGEGMFSTSHGMPFVFSDGTLLKTGSSREFKFWKADWVETEQIPILRSTDDGQTWEPSGVLPKRCDNISHQASSDPFIVTICRDGRVLTSTDKGETWEHEFGVPPSISDFPEVFRETDESEFEQRNKAVPPVTQ